MDPTVCDSANGYDGDLAIRVSSIFVILVGSALGAIAPVYIARRKSTKVSRRAIFAAKYIGSGVIFGTAFIHLLAPANEALSNPCLTGPITEYPWVSAICMMSMFLLFFVELMVRRSGSLDEHDDHGRVRERDPESNGQSGPVFKSNEEAVSTELGSGAQTPQVAPGRPSSPCMHGEDQLLSYAGEDLPSSIQEKRGTLDTDSYSGKLVSLAILEFGVIFHSVFIGLTLAVSGSEFNVLYAVLSLHQTFEGLALGSRLGSMDWPQDKKWTPYLMGLGYALSTPVAIGIGLGIRSSFNPGSQTALITNGVFDSISAGILLYTALIEILAHEFIFSTHMQRAPLKEVLAAVGCMALGALAMAVLGKWA